MDDLLLLLQQNDGLLLLEIMEADFSNEFSPETLFVFLSNKYNSWNNPHNSRIMRIMASKQHQQWTSDSCQTAIRACLSIPYLGVTHKTALH